MQVDGYSLDAQKDKLHKYADYQDMIIAGEYSDEGKSGKSVEGRPQFLQMLQGMAGGIAAGLVTMVFFLIGTGIRGNAVVTSDILMAAVAVLPLIVIIESFLIPVQLRFGNSKSRIFIMVLVGAVIAGVYVMERVVGDVEQKAAEVIKAVDGIKPLYVIIGVAAATMIILAVSVMCSMRVMRRKQY